jgi:hypothetical protein
MEKKYFRNIYSPVTHELFTKTVMTKEGIPERYLHLSNKVKIGDILISYIIGLKRFCGMAEVSSKFIKQDKPIYFEDDKYWLQCEVKNVIWLPLEYSIPIFTKEIWDNLSITKGLERSNRKWSGSFMGSIASLKDEDGILLEKIILKQSIDKIKYPMDKIDISTYNWYFKNFNKTEDKAENKIENNIENNIGNKPEEIKEKEYYESSKIQADLSKIGSSLGFKIWVPAHDRSTIKEISKLSDDIFIDSLPNDASNIVKQIDVLWVNKRQVVRAFEVEDTTSIYSGILRMCDLVEENPNTNTRLHIVAPSSRREKVFKEFCRPTFIKLQPLCSYIAYENIKALSENDNLEFFKESIIDKFCEYPEIVE